MIHAELAENVEVSVEMRPREDGVFSSGRNASFLCEGIPIGLKVIRRIGRDSAIFILITGGRSAPPKFSSLHLLGDRGFSISLRRHHTRSHGKENNRRLPEVPRREIHIETNFRS